MGRAHVVHDATQSRWTFIVGEHFVAAVPAGTDPAVVAALNERASRTVTVEELVSLIPLGGEGAVASFALVVAGAPSDGDGIPVSGVVRGDVVVDVYSVGGSRRFSDRGIRPWLLADFRAVTAIVIAEDGSGVPRPAEIGTGEPVGRGPSMAARLDWQPGEPPAVEVGGRSDAEVRSPPDAGAAPVGDTVHRPRRLAEHDTVLRPRRHELTPDAAAGEPVPAAEPQVEPAPEQRPMAERQPVTQPTDEQHPEPGPRPRFGLRIGQGDERELDAVYLIGRRPRLGRVPAVGEHVRLVDVPSPSREVSATHVEIRREGDVVVVTDQRSTNGTFIVPPHADRIRLRPGQSMVVSVGTMVHIGDGTIVTISALEDSRELSTDPPTTRRPRT
ncbi:FHA domain-containing protein [Leifsonia sp. YIM 134122]|uniref:FHA domain-containing protein n=1 Tax=Leifsonia stereocauli TaxID=3134136 RepID=A0ABU9W430_9MICO